jgi:hypothetical protein
MIDSVSKKDTVCVVQELVVHQKQRANALRK